MTHAVTMESPWDVRADDFPRRGPVAEQLRFLLRYAILAPSTWNSQPWKFAVDASAITIYADTARWPRAADANRRELYISLGCALENLLTAAVHFGYDAEVEYDSDTDQRWLPVAICVHLLGPVRAEADSPDFLFDAITQRHTQHEVYEPYALPREGLEGIDACSAGSDVRLQILADPFLKARMDTLLAHAEAEQFSNPQYRREFASAVDEGMIGTPRILSAISHLASLYSRPNPTATQNHHDVLTSAPLLGLLSSPDDSRLSQIKTGRTLERIWLTATSFGMHLHPISQITQVAGTREELARLLSPDVVPQIPFRLGYSQQERRHTPRRPLEDVLIEAT